MSGLTPRPEVVAAVCAKDGRGLLALARAGLGLVDAAYIATAGGRGSLTEKAIQTALEQTEFPALFESGQLLAALRAAGIPLASCPDVVLDAFGDHMGDYFACETDLWVEELQNPGLRQEHLEKIALNLEGDCAALVFDLYPELGIHHARHELWNAIGRRATGLAAWADVAPQLPAFAIAAFRANLDARVPLPSEDEEETFSVRELVDAVQAGQDDARVAMAFSVFHQNTYPAWRTITAHLVDAPPEVALLAHRPAAPAGDRFLDLVALANGVWSSGPQSPLRDAAVRLGVARMTPEDREHALEYATAGGLDTTNLPLTAVVYQCCPSMLEVGGGCSQADLDQLARTLRAYQSSSVAGQDGAPQYTAPTAAVVRARCADYLAPDLDEEGAPVFPRHLQVNDTLSEALRALPAEDVLALFLLLPESGLSRAENHRLLTVAGRVVTAPRTSEEVRLGFVRIALLLDECWLARVWLTERDRRQPLVVQALTGMLDQLGADAQTEVVDMLCQANPGMLSQVTPDTWAAIWAGFQVFPAVPAARLLARGWNCHQNPTAASAGLQTLMETGDDCAAVSLARLAASQDPRAWAVVQGVDQQTRDTYAASL